jgi:hypothetical protein
MLVYYSEYEDGHDSKFMNFNEMSRSNLSQAFMQLEMMEFIVVKLSANEKTMEKLKDKLSDVIENDLLWTAKLEENSLLKDDEIFILSDNLKEKI